MAKPEHPLMINQSILNIELTRYFNSLIGEILNPGLLGLKPGEEPFKPIKSLHYNQTTDTIYIEQEELMFVINLANNGKNLIANAYRRKGDETQ